jgi:uncharacterized protein (TIGR02757 family)
MERQGPGKSCIAFTNPKILKRNRNINLQQIYEGEKERLGALVGRDPVAFLHRFSDKRDIELAGFIASQFAYGRVQQVMRFLDEIFGRMTGGPYGFIREGDLAALGDLYYRFQKGPDIIEVLGTVRAIVERFEGIGPMIEHYYEGDFRRALWTARADFIHGGDSLLFFFPKPAPSSPLKRWHLYARWMVRRDEIDFGLWDFMDRSSLVIPLDANVFKIGTCRGWTDQRAPSWKAACQITDVLKCHSPDDPLKYDFFLCHVVGMDGGCKGAQNSFCRDGCILDAV